MGTVTTLRPRDTEPEAKSVVQVIETEDGSLFVINSDGMTKSQVVGHLVMAAVHMATA